MSKRIRTKPGNLQRANRGGKPASSKWRGIMSNAGKKLKSKDPAVKTAKEQYKYYEKTFKPIERKARREILSTGDIERMSETAGLEAAETSDEARAEFDRTAGRMGLPISQDQQQEIEGYFDQQRVGNEAGAMTRVRSGLYDQNLQNMGNYVALGRDLASTSQDAMANASANITATQNANKAMAANEKASAMSTGAMVGVGLMMAGAGAGAAVGTGVAVAVF